MRHQPHKSGSDGEDRRKDLTEHERRGLEDLGGGDQANFRVEDVKIIRRQGDDCDAIVDVAYDEMDWGTETTHGGGRSRIETVRETVAYFSRPKLKTPAFTTGQMGGFVGGAMRKLMGFLSMPTVTLPAHPEFNKQFAVMSFQPEATQKLFTQPVVDAISRHSEFGVQTATGRITVSQKGKTVLPSDRRAFYRSARETADRIVESAAALPAETLTDRQQMLQSIQTMDGWFGSRLRAILVSTQEVNDFLAQAPPRIAPHNIQKCAYGWNGFIMIVAAGFLLVGVFFVYVMMIGGFGDPGGARFVVPIAPLLAGVVLFFVARGRWRLRRILRYGICEQAKVVKILGTGIYGNGDQGHNVTFETESGRVVVGTGSSQASDARTLQERGETVRLLVDPQKQTRALWIDSFAFDAYTWEPAEPIAPNMHSEASSSERRAMPAPEAPIDRNAAVRRLQIPATALMGSVLLFGAIVIGIVWEKPPGDPLIAYIAAGFAVVSVVLQTVVGNVFNAIRRAPLDALAEADDGEREELLSQIYGLFQNRMIVQMALLETAAFFCLVALKISVQWWLTAAVVVLLAVMMTVFPTPSKFDRWMEQ